MKKSSLWQAFLAVSITALTVPAFAQSQTGTGSSSAGSSMRSGADTGTTSSPSAPSGATGSSKSMGSTSSPSSMGASGSAGATGMSAAADKATTEADRTLNQNIRQALTSDSSLGSASKNVHFDTNNGKVTLHGTVATEKEKKDLEAKVEKMTGVKDVDNQLQIAPAKTSSAADSMGSTGSAKPSGSSAMGSAGSAKSSASDDM